MDTPTGIAIDASGNVVVPLQGADEVIVVAVSTNNPGYPLRSDCYGGSSQCLWSQGDVYIVAGQAASPGRLLDGSSAATAQLDTPDYATFDNSGNLIVDEYNGGVAVLALSGSNPGYVLGDDCGGGSAQCVWAEGRCLLARGWTFQ